VNTPEAAAQVAPIASGSTRWAAACRWWAISITTATSCSRNSDCARALAKYRINPGNVGKERSATSSSPP